MVEEKLLITAGGKNVAPTKISYKLCESNFISQAVVVGDRERYLAALISVDKEYLHKWNESSETKIDLSGELSESTDLQNLIKKKLINIVLV